MPRLPPPPKPTAAWWRRALRASCGALLLAGLAPLAAGAEPPTEYQVKAAFLYNFTKFVEWPPRHFAAAESPITIGVLGADPFNGGLEAVVRGRRVGARPLVIRLLPAATAAAVDVLFVPAGQEALLDRATLASLGEAGVLTVGESPEFGALGGMINLVIEEHKVRFEINQAAAERGGLKLSAQLLKLATTVRRRL